MKEILKHLLDGKDYQIIITDESLVINVHNSTTVNANIETMRGHIGDGSSVNPPKKFQSMKEFYESLDKMYEKYRGHIGDGSSVNPPKKKQ